MRWLRLPVPGRGHEALSGKCNSVRESALLVGLTMLWQISFSACQDGEQTWDTTKGTTFTQVRPGRGWMHVDMRQVLTRSVCAV